MCMWSVYLFVKESIYLLALGLFCVNIAKILDHDITLHVITAP